MKKAITFSSKDVAFASKDDASRQKDVTFSIKAFGIAREVMRNEKNLRKFRKSPSENFTHLYRP
jgi:hypothetical protein